MQKETEKCKISKIAFVKIDKKIDSERFDVEMCSNCLYFNCKWIRIVIYTVVVCCYDMMNFMFLEVSKEMKLLGFYILTKNIALMVDFYKKVLRAEADGGGNHFNIILPDGNGEFVIWDNDDVADTVNEKMVLWFSVDDVDNEYEILLKMNVTILEPPVNNPWGARHMVFCDPDGNRIRFITPRK